MERAWDSGVKSTILIVDDDEGIKEYVSGVLTQAGYKVAMADDGEEAMEMVRKSAVPLVILDLFMPRRGGFQTITALRHHCPRAKVLAISGGGHFPLGDALLVAVKIGAHSTLQKPFTSSQLLSEVRNLLPLPVIAGAMGDE